MLAEEKDVVLCEEEEVCMLSVSMAGMVQSVPLTVRFEEE
jgi:hypothetical protein